MPTILTNGIQLPDKGSVDWYNSMQSNYNLIDTHLGNTDIHVTAEDKANWDSKQGSLSQAQLDAIAQVSTNTSDISALQSGKANASHTHSSSDITDIGDYATKTYVDTSISGLVDSAPAALDTLKELSTALGDDANFASTVTTALGNKANSADLATVATSGSYTDLSNKPSIPTVNDATLTIQKNGTTVNTFTANASSNVTCNITVPTKTSDLTNDSNFVDTSNSAVASGITSAKVSSYDSHIADTDIHVTTADKNKWNNNTYVLRYSSSSITDNSTIAYSTLDNTDNIKTGDKVIDVDGKIFTVVSVDTANQTVTVGTALIDLALDSNVVHTSGNETVGGQKTFSDNLSIYNSDNSVDTPVLNIKTSKYVKGDTTNTDTMRINFRDSNGNNVASVYTSKNIGGSQYLSFQIYTTDSNNANITSTINYYISKSGDKSFVPYEDNQISLGGSVRRWKSVYATNYYYGSNNVEFSTKFVTTDTKQTISGAKTFSSNTLIYNSDNTANTPNLILQSSKIQLGDTTASDSQGLIFNAGSSFVAKVDSFKDGSGTQNLQNHVRTKDASNNIITAMYRLRLFNSGLAFLESSGDNTISLGRNSSKWKDCQTYLINSLTPSSLSMPDIANKIDISSYITDLSGVGNEYTPTVNGWISIRSSNATKISILDKAINIGTTSISPTATYLTVLVPCIANRPVFINIMCTSLEFAYFIPCQGNV